MAEDDGSGPVSLADAAASAIGDAAADDGAAQMTFEGTNYTKVKFIGVQYDTLELDPKIGDEMHFAVRGKVVEVGDQAMKDGHIRHVVKVDVESVQPVSDAL